MGYMFNNIKSYSLWDICDFHVCTPCLPGKWSFWRNGPSPLVSSTASIQAGPHICIVTSFEGKTNRRISWSSSGHSSVPLTVVLILLFLGLCYLPYCWNDPSLIWTWRRFFELVHVQFLALQCDLSIGIQEVQPKYSNDGLGIGNFFEEISSMSHEAKLLSSLSGYIKVCRDSNNTKHSISHNWCFYPYSHFWQSVFWRRVKNVTGKHGITCCRILYFLHPFSSNFYLYFFPLIIYKVVRQRSH